MEILNGMPIVTVDDKPLLVIAESRAVVMGLVFTHAGKVEYVSYRKDRHVVTTPSVEKARHGLRGLLLATLEWEPEGVRLDAVAVDDLTCGVDVDAYCFAMACRDRGLVAFADRVALTITDAHLKRQYERGRS